MEVKVLHEGTLEKCSSADDQVKKDWKKRYFVFKHFPTSSTKCLEYYKDKNWRKQDAKGVLALHPGYEVIKVHDAKKKFVFDVKTVEHVFRLSAHSEDDLNKWILILEKENVVKSFVVEPVQDSVMAKIGAPDYCHLFIADTEIRLVSAQDGSQIVAWPFTCLRRYMSSQGKFSLEAGRRAPTGEGKFVFITSQHEEIYKVLDNVIKSRAGGTAQPPPPPRPIGLPIPVSSPHEDSYDHLMSSPLKGITPAHSIHPNYDQNPVSTLSQRRSAGPISDYASPYSHVKNRESVSSARDIVPGEGYDTLIHQADSKAFPTEGYDTLNPNKPTRVAPPPPPEDMYNTIDNNVSSGNKLVQHASGSSPTDDTYDSLNYKQGSPNKRYTFTSPERQASVEGDTYNVLAHMGSPVSSPTLQDEYSALDRPQIPLRQSKSFPIPPSKVPSTAGYDRSSISRVSSFGSYDHTTSIRDSRLSTSSVPADDQDFYSSIDNDAANKQTTPKPTGTANNTEEERNKQNLVSSLRASLIADGLNLNKINPVNIAGRRRCSVDTIDESDTYDSIDEENKKNVVARPARSPSAPPEYVEDIYEDPDNQPQQRPSKPKLPGPKPTKPRKKK